MSERSMVIADDHPIFRRGLREVIEEDTDFHVIGEASDGRSALELARRLKPAIMLIDLSMPEMDGFELAERLRQEQLRCSAVVMTMHADPALVDRAMSLGIAGYLLKDDAYGEVQRCLETVSRGELYLSPSIGSTPRLRHPLPAGQDGEALVRLTPMQRRILKLLAEYKTSKEIAQTLHVSHRTVQNHRANIATALGLQGRNRLLEFAARVRDLL